MSYYDIQSLICPRCGFEQPETAECANCGIIFDKWNAQNEAHPADEGPWGGADDPEGQRRADTGRAEPIDRRAIAAQQHAQAAWGDSPLSAAPAPPAESGRDSGALMSGAGVALFRLLLGIGSAGAATWLALSVNPLDNYVAMAIVAISGGLFVWTALSFRQGVASSQLALETLLAMAVAAGVVVTMPGLLGEESAKGNKGSKQAAGPSTAADGPLSRYTKRSSAYLDAVEALLAMEPSAPHVQWDGLTPQLDFEKVRSGYQALSEMERGEALVSWEKVRPTGEFIIELLKIYKKATDDGFSFEPSRVDRARATAAHAAARSAVDRLMNEINVTR